MSWTPLTNLAVCNGEFDVNDKLPFSVFDIVVELVLDVHVPIDVVVVVDDAATRDATGVVVQASVVSTMGFDGGVGTDGAAAATVKTTGDED